MNKKSTEIAGHGDINTKQVHTRRHVEFLWMYWHEWRVANLRIANGQFECGWRFERIHRLAYLNCGWFSDGIDVWLRSLRMGIVQMNARHGKGRFNDIEVIKNLEKVIRRQLFINYIQKICKRFEMHSRDFVVVDKVLIAFSIISQECWIDLRVKKVNFMEWTVKYKEFSYKLMN